jgi:HEAT repeat protein
MKKTALPFFFLLCTGLLFGQELPEPPRELPALPADITERLSTGSETEETPAETDISAVAGDGPDASGSAVSEEPAAVPEAAEELSPPAETAELPEDLPATQEGVPGEEVREEPASTAVNPETTPPAPVSGRHERPVPVLPEIPSGPYMPASQKTLEEQRLDIIRFGTENEIVSLIQTLKSENIDYLDDALIVMVQNTVNRNILSGVFSFFTERTKGGLEDRALRALENWDIEATDTVLGAIDYLGKLKVEAAIFPLRGLLDIEERRFMNVVFRSLGRIGGGIPNEAEEIAEYLIDYYTSRNPGEENRRDIIVALGETHSPKGIEFLSEIAENNDERVPLRIAAMEALSKIGDPAGLDAVLSGASSQDPNVRAAAVSALGPFEGSEVNAVILEAFRDSFYRTRIGAAQAAGIRKMKIAVSYLAYRAERDEVPQVKDEAIRALGAIGTKEAETVLSSFFTERKNPDRIRILAAEMLIRDHAEDYAEKLVVELDDAKGRNQTALYNGFLRVIGSAKAPSLEAVTQRFLVSGGVIEKSYALDMAVNNEFRRLMEEVRTLTDPKNGNLARKAQAVLEKLDPSARPNGNSAETES